MKIFTKKTLVIIAGAAGEIGTEFCREVVKRKIDCVGVIRKKPVNLSSPYLNQITCNLDNENDIVKSFSVLDLAAYKKIIFIHTIGVDYFDPRGYPKIQPLKTIPEDVYNTNVNSFKYVLRYLVNKLDELNKNKIIKTKLKVTMLGGESDKYAPFVIESFCEAKFIARQYIRSFIDLHPDFISGLSINITSTITESALKVRPFANTEHWLTPSEVVFSSIKETLRTNYKYKEISVIKPSPKFKSGYYQDNHALFEKWSKETGFVK